MIQNSEDDFNTQDDFDSIEKLDWFLDKETPYVSINCNVLLNFRDPVALLIWCYLSGKPKNWKINKKHIKKHFGFSDEKVKKAFSTLNKSNLIKYIQIKDASGCIRSGRFRLSCGDKFDSQVIDKTRGRKSTPLGFPPADSLYTTNTKKDNIILYSSSGNSEIGSEVEKKVESLETPEQSFRRFYEIYPRKKKPRECLKIWIRDRLHSRCDELIADIQKRLTEDRMWQEIDFIMYPSTYLGGKRWEDEIDIKKQVNKQITKNEIAQQVASVITDDPTERAVRDLYLKFSIAFGPSFNSQYTTEILVSGWIDSWKAALKPFSYQQILSIAEKICQESKWAPKIEEFLSELRKSYSHSNLDNPQRKIMSTDEVFEHLINGTKRDHPLIIAVLEFIGEENANLLDREFLRGEVNRAYTWCLTGQDKGSRKILTSFNRQQSELKGIPYNSSQNQLKSVLDSTVKLITARFSDDQT
jgi:hypothetical protein